MPKKHAPKTVSDALGDARNDLKYELDVRLGVVMHRVASFYTRADSNQLCCCLESVAHLDTAEGATTTLQAHELVVVPDNTLHRVEGRAVVLVIDSIKG